MPGKRWSVPFITETTEVWEVEAPNERSAAMEATIRREKHLTEPAGEKSDNSPTHSHMTKFQLGTIRTTIAAPSQVAGGEGNVTDISSAQDPRRSKA